MTVLLDTNVLVYLHDATAPLKQAQAWEVSEALATSGRGCVSTQVLSEFFNVLRGPRFRRQITHEMALTRLERHSRAWTIFDVTAPVILAAARGAQDHQLNFWDAQIWAVAKLHGIPTILSEDFNSGSTIGGVHFLNPFARDFHPRQII